MTMNRREMLKRSAAATIGVAVPSYLVAQTETLAGKLAKYAAEKKDMPGITRFRETPFYDVLSVIPEFKKDDQSRITSYTRIETPDFNANIETQIYTQNGKRNYIDPRNSLTVSFKSKENDVNFTDKGIDNVIDSGTATFQGKSGFVIADVIRDREILDKASINALETLARFYESRK